MDYPATAPVVSRGSDIFGDDDSVLADAMVGLADSQNLQEINNSNGNGMRSVDEALNDENRFSYEDDCFPMDVDLAEFEDVTRDSFERMPALTDNAPMPSPVVKHAGKAFLFNSSSTPQSTFDGPEPMKTAPNDLKSKESKHQGATSVNDRQTVYQRPNTVEEPSVPVEDEGFDILDICDDEPVNEAPAQAKPVPDVYKDLEPWLFEEFGDIVELVDE
jgi:ATP-dependent DNA helicase HFM1/MER3